MTYSELTLRFDVKPTPHQSFRMGRNGISYTPKKVLDFKKDIAWELSSQLPNDFQIIKAGTPIVIEYLHYCFAYPVSMSKKKRLSNPQKTTKPDLLDNLNKAFIDALEGIVFEQDQNIVEVRSLKKTYGIKPSIEIKLLY